MHSGGQGYYMAATGILLILAVIIVAAIVWASLSQRRTTTLRSNFGSQYDRMLHEYGRRDRADAPLPIRRRRSEKLQIRPLPPELRERFRREWRGVQSHFVDDPSGATRAADLLLNEIMVARGYPMGQFEQRAGELAVDFPHVVRNYRAAHAVAVRSANGTADPEEMRQALVYYRDLFDELLGASAVGSHREDV
jgi:hypothetical protein